jgi:hypothetical protein
MPIVTREKSGQEKSKDVGAFPIDHISTSAMVSFSTNPVLFKIKYINHDVFDTTSGIAGVIGKSFHLAMNVYYGGSDEVIISSESEAIEYGLKAGMDFLNAYNDGFIEYSVTIPNKQKALEILSFCFNSYIKESAYNHESIISTEEKIVEQVSVLWRGKTITLPIRLKGYMDKVERTEEGKIRIVDYKTCHTFSSPDRIDGAKILQAIEYYLLAYAHYGEEPYSLMYEEIKYTKNKDGSPQVRRYEIVYADNDLYFDFYFRFYGDMIRALNGEMVYVPNVRELFDNEVAIISYIHRLDIASETAEKMRNNRVENLTELLKKEIQSTANVRRLMKAVESKFTTAKNIDYKKMTIEEKIGTKMMEFGIMLSFDSKIEGATVDLYRYFPSIGVKMARLRSFVDDIEQVIGIAGIRVLAPIPNSNLIGFEVPRAVRTYPNLPEGTADFELAIGQTVHGEVRRFDVRKSPHILVAGSSGSGKSVFLHSIIRQLIKLPNVDLHLMDPKQVEFLQYDEQVNEYRHSPDGIKASLEDLIAEMENRYNQMKKLKIKSIEESKKFKYKFIIIDEYADLKFRTDIDSNIKVLAQKGRACGIHLIIATQRASTKIIDGDVKMNFPTKVVFRMGKEVDSRVMIDEPGAEKLLGKGDCLFAGEWGTERLQAYNTI